MYRKKGYPKEQTTENYAVPELYKYPLDTEAHVRAAISYFSMPRNYTKFKPEERKLIWKRIVRAAKKYGIEVEDKYKFGKAGVDAVEKLDILLKAFGKKDISKLQKKTIIDKKGVKRTVYVKDEKKKDKKDKGKIKKKIKNKIDKSRLWKERKQMIKNIVKELLDMIIRQYEGEGTEEHAAGAVGELKEGAKRTKEEKRRIAEQMKRKKLRKNEKVKTKKNEKEKTKKK